MKMKPEYVRNLLIAAESIQSPTPTVIQIAKAYYVCGKEDEVLDLVDDEYILHYELLFDYGFLESMGSTSGINRALSGEVYFADYALRITAHGHEFLAAIEKDNVWTVIKDKFSEESLDTIFTISKQLATNFAKKKLERYLD